MQKIDKSTVKMGSDAEVFLYDRARELPFPACGLIGGTKEKPRKLTDDGVAVQEDNVMLEFNTPVSQNRDQWVQNIQKAYRLAVKEIPPTFYPVLAATAKFDPKLLESEQACRFGCEPDFNAWTMEQNPRPEAKDPTKRSAAAHVHLSWANPEGIDQRCRVIQMADALVVLPSLYESGDRERRELYGKAGAFRPKEYGAEHRVLDNYWLGDEFIASIWDRYMEAIDAANSEIQLPKDMAEEIQHRINNYVTDGLEEFMSKVRQTLLPERVKEEEAYYAALGVRPSKRNSKKAKLNRLYTGAVLNGGDVQWVNAGEQPQAMWPELVPLGGDIEIR